MKRALACFAILVSGGCGGDDGGTTTDAATGDSPGNGDAIGLDATSGVFALTSTMWTEGQPINVVFTCDDADTSPPLAWANPPAGAQSFAIIFTDLTFNNYLHSIIYDIPSTTTSLPANVMKAYAPTNAPGAHQTLAFDNTTRGYRGPCPPMADGPHTYEFAIYAINAATLPGSMMSTTRAAAKTAILANAVGTPALLTGTRDR